MTNKISEVHPELRGMINRIPKFSVTSGNLWLWRFLMNLSGAAKAPDDVSIQDVLIPDKDKKSKIRLRVYRPKSAAGLVPGLVWLHGGGYVIGKPEMNDLSCIQFVRELGIVVVSVDYRYAPHYPFPIPLEDGYAALQWIRSRRREIGIDNRICIGGASAGAGLAAALAQLAYDRKELQLVGQLLVYPMLDDRTSTRADLSDHEVTAWSRASNRFGWESYLRSSSRAATPPEYAVPARRADLSGLPPAWIGVGTIDLFHAEDVAYAQRLQACGVECELLVIPGAFHGFDVIAPQAKIVRDFQQAQIEALRKFLFSTKQKFAASEMTPGKTYRIIKAFTNFDGGVHNVGERWKFLGQNFLPYEDGLTLSIELDGKQRMFRMQWRDEAQGEVISNFSDYVEEIA